MILSLSDKTKRSSKSSFLFLFFFLFSFSIFSQNHLHIKISSENLSEDYSSLSTKNDELFLFVFQKSDIQYSEVFSHEFIFDSTLKTISYTTVTTNFSDSLYFFIIEIDSKTPLEDIKEKISSNPNSIILANLNLDIRKIRKLLNDEDVISARKFKLEQTKFSFIETNFNLLDKFEYFIEISIVTI